MEMIENNVAGLYLTTCNAIYLFRTSLANGRIAAFAQKVLSCKYSGVVGCCPSDSPVVCWVRLSSDKIAVLIAVVL